MTGFVVAAAIAGGLASVVRYLVTLRLPRPWGVLAVNLAGSFIGGLAVGLAQAAAVPEGVELVLLGGLAGGLTTFSTLGVDTIELMEEGRWIAASASVGTGLLVGVLAAGAGWLLGAG